MFFQLRVLIWRMLATRSLRQKGFGPKKGNLQHLIPTEAIKQMMLLKKMLSKYCQSGKSLEKEYLSSRVLKSPSRKKAFLKLMKSRKERTRSFKNGGAIVKRRRFASLWNQRLMSREKLLLRQPLQNKSLRTNIVASQKRSFKSMKNLMRQELRRPHLLLW